MVDKNGIVMSWALLPLPLLSFQRRIRLVGQHVPLGQEGMHLGAARVGALLGIKAQKLASAPFAALRGESERLAANRLGRCV